MRTTEWMPQFLRAAGAICETKRFGIAKPLVQSLRFHMRRRGCGKNTMLAIDNQLADLCQNDFPYALLGHVEASATVGVMIP